MVSKFVNVFALWLLFSLSLWANSDRILFDNVEILPSENGKKQIGDVLLRGETIEQVATQILPQTSDLIIDGKNKILTPSLIDTITKLGLIEIESDSNSNDKVFSAGDIRARYNVEGAVNPYSSLIPVARMEGVGAVGIFPEGGVVSGSAIFYNLGLSQEKALNIVLSPAAVVAEVSAQKGDTRSKCIMALRDLFNDAKRYQVHKGPIQDFPFLYPRLRSPEDYESVLKVLNREIPLVVHVDRATDIESVMRLADDFHFKLVLAGATESWKLAEKLGAEKIPVIVFPLNNLPESFDAISARSDLAAILEKNSVPVILSSFDAYKVRQLRQLAGIAVREGLSYEKAIAAITSTPAKVFNLPKTARIKPGYFANLTLWDGDPLEISTKVLHLYVRGKELPLESRQTALFKRYRKIDQTLYLQP
jgi:imidazolonepropionase-like amidohydrolase